MQERKNIGRFISLVVLAMVTVLLYFFQQSDSRPSVDPALFRAEDPSRIDHVVLESKSGKVDLHYDGNHWMVNGRFEADRSLIDVLFAALAQALPKRPVAASQLDSINRLLDQSGVKVNLLEGLESKKEFVTGGDSQKRETYFRRNNSNETFLMAIPGYRVYLSDIFSIAENGWRDKRVFDFAWRNFKSLKVAFPAEPAAGFEISRPDMNLTVTLAGLNDPDTTRVNAFLDDLLQLTVDQILSPGTKRYDSLALTRPLCGIEVMDIAARKYGLELFAALPGESLVLGKAHDDLVLIDRKRLFRIVKKKSYFVRKTR